MSVTRWQPDIVTYAPDGVSDRRHLNAIGQLSGITWGSTMPGGDDQFQATLALAKLQRDPAIAVGRILQVVSSGAVLYEGRLDRPAPSGTPATGWTITAHGSGTYGDDYLAIYSSYTAANILSQAQGRGLRWTTGTTTGGNLSQVADSGAQTITQFMNNYCDTVSLTWFVDQPRNLMNVMAVPSTVTRLLVTTIPATPDLIDYINTLYVRYQTSADGAATATYGLTSSALAASVALHGTTEDYWDLSASGQLSTGAAQATASGALAKYVSASFSQPFTAFPGQYLTTGGQPVDLANERAGEVCRLILAAGGFSGEIGAVWPITFPVGAVSYSNDAHTLQITPYQSVMANLSGLLGLLAPVPRPPAKPKPKPKPTHHTVPRKRPAPGHHTTPRRRA